MMRIAIAVIILLAFGCQNEPEAKQELRRELLTPPDRTKQRAEYDARTALLDDKGKLLESSDKVAELTLPRGLEPIEAQEHVWRYSAKRVTLAQLDAYFAARLFTAEIDRRVTGAVTYLRAHVKAAPDAPRINVSLTPMGAKKERVELRIERIARRAEPKRVPSEAEIRQRILDRRKYGGE